MKQTFLMAVLGLVMAGQAQAAAFADVSAELGGLGTVAGQQLKLQFLLPIQENCVQQFKITSLAVERLGVDHYKLALESDYKRMRGRDLCKAFGARTRLTLTLGEMLPRTPLPQHVGPNRVVTIDVVLDSNRVSTVQYSIDGLIAGQFGDELSE